MSEKVRKYTIKEVSKSLKIPVGKLRQWEGSFQGLFYVQRTKTGARIYTEYELEMLKKIKLLKDKNVQDEDIKYILVSTESFELEDSNEDVMTVEDNVRYFSLQQEETVETVRHLADSLHLWKRELVDEITSSLKHEVVQEITKGNNKTKSMVESYSQIILDSSETTNEEIRQLRQEIEREEEEKLFVQQKLEEREEQFQEFVQQYRQVAAARIEQMEKRRFSNWLHWLTRTKKQDTVDYL